MKKLLLSVSLFAVSFAAKAQLPAYAPALGVIGYWPLHKTLIDSSVNSYDGTGTGITYTYDRLGNVGGACNFSAATDYVQISGLPLNTNGSYTLNFWMNLKIYHEGDVLFDLHPSITCGDFPQLREQGDSIVLAKCTETVGYSLGHKADYTNFWHMMTFEVKADTTTVYMDGVVLRKIAVSWDVSTLAELTLGNIHNATESYTKAALVVLDDAGLWSRLLNACELADLYYAATLSFTAQPENVIASMGSTATFEVTASRPGVAYQWQSNIGAGGSFIDIYDGGQYIGANTRKLEVSMITTDNSGQQFRCMLTDSLGKCSVVSDAATLSIEELGLETFSAPSSYLQQNMPNPSAGNTLIPYNVASMRTQACIIVYDIQGNKLKVQDIYATGKGVVNLQQGDLPAGMYYYSLFIDGVKIDTHKMIIAF